MSFRPLRRFGAGRSVQEQALDDELALHLELLAEELEGEGYEPEAARREAARRFGDPRRYRDACRAIDTRLRAARTWRSWSAGLAHDLRAAWRGCRKHPAYALAVIALLGLTIGANAAIFGVLDAVVLRPLALEEPDRLAKVSQTRRDRSWSGLSVTPANFVDWREQATSFSSMAAYHRDSPTLTGGGEPRRVNGAVVSSDFFVTARRAPLLGRALRAEDTTSGDADAAVLAERLWRGRFGADPTLIGKTIEIDGRPHRVVGVMPETFDLPPNTELWRPLVFDFDIAGSRGAHYLQAIGRLAPGVDWAQARAELDTIAQRLEATYPKTNAHSGIDAQPLKDDLVGSVRPILVLLLAAVGAVLAIACVNVANLTLARTVDRARELSVRAALGAGRGQLARQIVLECLLLTAIGAAVGALLARVSLAGLIAAVPFRVPRLDEAAIDGRVLLFVAALTCVTALLFALAPARALLRADLASALREAAHTLETRLRDSRLRRLLIVVEVALALVLVTGAGLVIKSLDRLLAVEPGFRIDRVLTFELELPEARYEEELQPAFFERLRAGLEAVPGVRSVGMASWLPLDWGWSFTYKVVGQPEPEPGQSPNANLRMVDAGYFDTLAIPVLRGRGLEASDRAGAEPVMVINEAMARQTFGDGEAVGAQVIMGYGEQGSEVARRVVGVVGNVRQRGLDQPAPASMYVPHLQVPFSPMGIVLATDGPPAAWSQAVRDVVRALDPALAVDRLEPMRARFDSALAQRRFLRAVLGAFAALALVLAALGIYGLIAELVIQRRGELGLRMALGAGSGDIVRLVLGRGLALAGAGLALGLLAAWPAGRLIEHHLYGTRPLDPATFAAVALLLLAVALLACWLPARRAGRIDPAVTLREG